MTSNICPAPGYVVIERDKDATGVNMVSTFQDEATYLPVVGTVKAVSGHRPFMRNHLATLKKPSVPSHRRGIIIDDYNAMPEWLGPVEVKPGDRVIYSHWGNSEEDTMEWQHVQSGDLVMKYEDLYARLNPDGTIYPLNGMIFVDAIEIRTMFAESDYKNGWIGGRVIAEGCFIEYYKDFPGREDKFWKNTVLTGSKIYTRPKDLVIVDSIMNSTMEQSVYWCHRKDIYGFETAIYLP